MKTIELTNGFVALVDDADYAAVSAHEWYANIQDNTVYAQKKNGRAGTLTMHRFIMGPDGPKVDHRNGNGLDNQRENLRPCSSSQNSMNRRKRSGCSSQYKGVSLHGRFGNFRVAIKIGGKSKHLGCFTSEIDAALCYDRAARELFGEFALTNFPPKKPCVIAPPASIVETAESVA